MDKRDGNEKARDAILDAAVMHVPFDGWSDATLRASVHDSGVAPGLARALFPRGGVDLALAYHRRGNERMLEKAATVDLGSMRYSERVAALIRFRLEAVEDKELVRRGSTLFSLPQHAADGARALWGTADRIWMALGDTSRDVNWYTKRATLSAVYGATVLYWLGDETPGHYATWEFLDRRIDDVLRIEKLKAEAQRNPLVRAMTAGPRMVMRRVHAPAAHADVPGRTGHH
ncbi:COQ9 family protein [Cereibacter azotoformans]|uniref:Ubiquinone biosynthesis protein COQ9 n=1 Tax=Cereibacter azotoformans TaxID=43057 RepID=A0A2T5K7V5_9RHOB|nr:COQ9 family protein [Cereibacter azotoformans]AXQ94304.1 COQ9 family protein [Cereibacter sphaeroides]MBO4167876.1 COQ9 family protein [Cereibacter azotoformans]PTR18438.1 ubiquinone biosynthesis protein COQ9 [Cereibacter azotoformans]UIJ29849.1 COQ9 family protein [Cereibacter azotoformans]